MFKWLLGLFGYGKIKSVEEIMQPMIKTRNQLAQANKQRNDAITNNVKRIEAINAESRAHAAEAHLSNVMLEGIDAQLKPLMKAKAPEVAKRG